MLPRPVFMTTLTPALLKNPPTIPMLIWEPVAACATGSATLNVGTDPLEPPPELLELEPQPTQATAATSVAPSNAGLTSLRVIVYIL